MEGKILDPCLSHRPVERILGTAERLLRFRIQKNIIRIFLFGNVQKLPLYDLPEGDPPRLAAFRERLMDKNNFPLKINVIAFRGLMPFEMDDLSPSQSCS